MTHSDPDALAMLAMGETDLPAEDVRHIDSCPECLAELSSLRRVADLARSGGLDDPLGAPRPEVWTRISESLGLRSDLRPAPVAIDTAPASTIEPPASAPALPPVVVAAPAPTADAAAPVGRRRRTGHRRSRRRIPLLVGAAGGLVAVGAAALVAALVLQPSADVLSSTELEALTSGGDGGVATVEQSGDGVRDVVVRVDGADAVDGYREVWLASADLDRLISLGTLAGSEGRFALPDSVDLAEYSVVDVSVEPLDGDPAHSGDSVLRGTLPS